MGGNGRVTRCGAHKRRCASGPSAPSVDGFPTICHNQARETHVGTYAAADSKALEAKVLASLCGGAKAPVLNSKGLPKKRKVNGVWA